MNNVTILTDENVIYATSDYLDSFSDNGHQRKKCIAMRLQKDGQIIQLMLEDKTIQPLIESYLGLSNEDHELPSH